MTGHTRVKLLNSALSVALAIGLNWILIPPMGIVGAALAAVGSIAIVNILRLLQVRLLVGVQPYDTSWLKPIAAGLAAALPPSASRSSPVAPRRSSALRSGRWCSSAATSARSSPSA